MIAKKGKDTVSIPIPSVDIPRFKHGDKQQGGVGQGAGEPGDALGQGEEQPGSGHEAGDRPGDHLLDIELSVQELAEIMGEELELPRIQPKGTEKIVAYKDKYSGIRTVGPGVAAALPPHVSPGDASPDLDGHVRREEPGDHPGQRGQALPLVAQRAAAAVERGDHLHDGRLGLDGRRAEGDRPHRELLDRYVAALAVSRHREPLHHSRRDGQRGRSRHVLPHPRVGRHDDQLGVQAVREDDQRRVPARICGTSIRSTSPTATTGRSTTRIPASSC